MPRSIRVSAALLAALVLTLTLTLGTAPAAHAAGADRGPVGLADWLALLWHHLAGGGPGLSGTTSLFAPAGGDMDPDGTPAAPPPEGSSMDPDGGVSPTAGSDMDPDG